ncbi:MAG: hypothetical protein JNK05_03715 [Myxococcales bacterium]|nr:hypothetical protein [Myxococcales bacterium]
MRKHSHSLGSTALFFAGAAALVVGVAWAQPQPPGGGHGGQRPTPPQEAFSACANLQAGASCAVNFQGRTISGTCASFTDGRMFCRPEGMPPPPNGGR